MLVDSTRARSGPGRRRRRPGSASARGSFRETHPLGHPIRAARGKAGGGPRPRSPEQSRGVGPGYSQQEAHVGSGVGCGLGGREASGRQRRQPGKRRKGERRERGGERRLFGPQQLVRLRYFQGQGEGAEVGSARLESLNGRGRKRRRGKGRSLSLESSHRGRLQQPLLASSPDPFAPTPRTLARATRTHSGPPAAAPGPSRSGHLGSPGPRPASRLQPPGQSRGLSTGLVSCGRELRAASQRSGKKWASNPECQGPTVRDGIATRILPSVSAGQSLMKGYGVSLLVHKNRRQFHLVGMVRMWFCQTEERI